MSKLKNCPLCGSDRVKLTTDYSTEDGNDGLTVCCGSCGCMLEPWEMPYDDDGNPYDEDSDEYDTLCEEITERWNRRGVDSCMEAVLRCGDELAEQLVKYANKIDCQTDARKLSLFRRSLKAVRDAFEKSRYARHLEPKKAGNPSESVFLQAPAVSVASAPSMASTSSEPGVSGVTGISGEPDPFDPSPNLSAIIRTYAQ